VSLRTTHVERTDHDVAATLEAIRRLMEATVQRWRPSQL
jgi:hypothetical protein